MLGPKLMMHQWNLLLFQPGLPQLPAPARHPPESCRRWQVWQKVFFTATEKVGRFRDLLQTSSFSWPYWEESPDFNIAEHFRTDGHEYQSHAEVEAMVSAMIKKPFDYARPPWEVILIPRYVDQEGTTRHAFMFRFHHGMADGFNMTRLFFQCLEPAPRWPASSAPPKGSAAAPPRPKRPSALTLGWSFVTSTLKILFCQQDPVSALKPATSIDLQPVHSSWCLCDLSVTDLKVAAKVSPPTALGHIPLCLLDGFAGRLLDRG
jgi:hypothetical protein